MACRQGINKKMVIIRCRQAFLIIDLRETGISHFAWGSVFPVTESNHWNSPETWMLFFATRRYGTFLSKWKSI